MLKKVYTKEYNSYKENKAGFSEKYAEERADHYGQVLQMMEWLEKTSIPGKAVAKERSNE